MHNNLVCKQTLNHLAKIYLNCWEFFHELSSCRFEYCCSHDCAELRGFSGFRGLRGFVGSWDVRVYKVLSWINKCLVRIGLCSKFGTGIKFNVDLNQKFGAIEETNRQIGHK